MKLLGAGSVKDMYEIEGTDELEFRFSDRISVFDKPIATLIPYKGEVLCRITVYWFELAADLGIRTHFIRQTSRNTMRVRRVEVIKDYNLINSQTRNYLIPIEFITRYYVAGTLHDRLKNGTIKPPDLGFDANSLPGYGQRLPSPYFETATKFEQWDIFIEENEALRISGLTDDRLSRIREVAFELDEKINSSVQERGLIHVDGKKEFAIDKQGEIMVVDALGTPDEDRFWDADEYSRGRYDELSKEFVRQHYRNSGYKDELYSARDKGLPEPDIPPVPDDIVKKTSEVYVQLYERITGERF